MGTYTIQRVKKLAEEVVSAALAGRGILQQYSIYELAEIYNGIGPDRFPMWLRELITDFGSIFEPAALIHDVRYEIGGTKTDFTRANDEFRQNCYTLVKRKYSWWRPLRYILLNKARRWAEYCELFGLSGYHLKEDRK